MAGQAYGDDYEIQYKKGKENMVADALSRRVEGMEREEENVKVKVHAVSVVAPQWLSLVADSYVDDNSIKELVVALTTCTNSHPEYTYQKRVIRHKDRILVGSGSDLRQNLIACFHDTCWGGHSGIQGTYQRMKLFFYWPNMRKDIETYVQKCDICSRSKSENCPYPGLL